MRTEDMLSICPQLDAVGYWSLECWGGATYDSCLRFLKQDPWERLRQLRKALPNTRLQMLLRGQNLLGYRHYSDDVVSKFVELSAGNGIDVFRIFDALNDVRNMELAVREVKKHHKHAQGAISYTTSPVHNVAQFVKLAKQLQDLGCDSIAVKDMAGLLTPAACTELIAALVKAVNIPVQLHSHATSGLSSICHYKAVENGCRHIDTAISSFADGASHPSTESLVAAFRDTEYDTGLDLNKLLEISQHFKEVRKKYHQFESAFTGQDIRVQINQLPGGMISNLSNQLREQGALEKMHDVLDEVPRVRHDLGYPPLVTPTSQIVGTQAVLNVITGEPYNTITNEVKRYLQGKYGRAPGEINTEVRQKAIGKEEPIDCRPADLLSPELVRLRADIGDLADNEEDVLTYAMFPDVGREFLDQRKLGTLTPEPLEPLISTEQRGPVPVEFNATLHGETYHIRITGTGHPMQTKRAFFVNVDGIQEEIMLETLQELPGQNNQQGAVHQKVADSAAGSQRPRATKPGHVTTSMPGTIVDVLVNVGDDVQAGDPLLVTEAMKMETEIQAPVSGAITAVHVAKGDTVNPDEALIEIDGP